MILENFINLIHWILSRFFNYNISQRLDYNKILIHCNQSVYYQYTVKSILKDSDEVGKIITLTDMTQFVTMLDALKVSQDEAQNVNEKLAGYKDMVYDIEKEKEIGNLLESIAKDQQIAMSNLIEEIRKIESCMDESFIDEISLIINNAKGNLQDVRNVVTSYMNYYEE